MAATPPAVPLQQLFGLHRSLAPRHFVPQACERVDSTPQLLSSSEVLLEVQILNLDSTSMRQLREKAATIAPIDSAKGHDILANSIADIIRHRGKMHNPVTDSGGVLVAKVAKIGPDAPMARDERVQVGSMIVPLCSLTAIPLHVANVGKISGELVYVQGSAILFSRYKYAVVPADLAVEIVLGAIDVSRLLPQVHQLLAEHRVATRDTNGAHRPPSVAVIGCGRAGMFAMACVRSLEPGAYIVGTDVVDANLESARALGLADVVVKSDAQSPAQMLTVLEHHLHGTGADFVLNLVNVSGTETPTIVACRDGGTVVFFSMATSFARAALGTDATGKNVKVLIGAGVFPEQADLAFGLLRQNPALLAYAEATFLHHPTASRAVADDEMRMRPGAQWPPRESLWVPTAAYVRDSNLMAFVRYLRDEWEIGVTDAFPYSDPISWYRALQAWSVRQPGAFWAALWDYAGIPESRPPTAFMQVGPRFRDARFMVGARTNHAQALLRHAYSQPDRIALIGRGEAGVDSIPRRTVTYGDLLNRVATLAASLRANGLRPGDRVGALMPNSIETVVCMLAVTAVGGVWAACSPDLGAKVLADRFTQILPRMLITVESYTYGQRVHKCWATAAELAERVRSIELIVVAPHIIGSKDKNLKARCPVVHYDQMMASVGTVTELQHFYEQVPFDHPVYILFTSGTTGPPKCIVQGFGVTLNHIKETLLQCNIRGSDTCFVYTNSAWMVWHWHVSVLALGCTVVCYDGSPFHPDATAMWRLLAEERVNYFGCSARFLAASEKALVSPGRDFDLSQLNLITSTGSPLTRHSSRWVYAAVKRDLKLASISGGTEINGCLAMGTPVHPVLAGEIDAAPLGVDARVLDEAGREVYNTRGELAVTAPFPSMPLFFWGDTANGDLYHKTYFNVIPNVWVHADYAERSTLGYFTIHGRSDATLNPGGVRLGTGDYYSVVNSVPGVVDSIVVGQPWQGDERVVLFVQMAEGHVLNDEAKATLRDRIRTLLSPKHIPAAIVSVRGIPVNANFKKLETLVKKIVSDPTYDPSAVFSSLQNPECLSDYQGWARQLPSKL